MIIQGSINYSPSGRKRRATTRVKKVQPAFKPLKREPSYRREDPHYPSAPMTPYKPSKDTTYQKEVSKNYTVSIAYNKGAYMVIPQENVKDIGK